MSIKEFLRQSFLIFFSVTHKRRGINFENQRLANELHKLGLKKTKYIDPVKTKLGV